MIVGGKYRLEQRLGQGGFKDVWRGVRLADGQAVAVAVLHRFDATSFHNEVSLAQRVRSPHVAQVLDSGFDAVQAYVVSELCEGKDLRGHLNERGPLAWDEAARLVHQLALGLAAIHAAHVLHRDVKPDNAILTDAGVKVIDFGISLPALNETTAVLSLVPTAGTPSYMAPEAFHGEVDARTDVYALGMTLFELATGGLPFRFDNMWELIRRLKTLEPLDLSALGGRPPVFRALVADMLAVQKERRPYMPEVASRLAEIVGAAPAPSAAGSPELAGPLAASPAAAPLYDSQLPLRLRARIALPAAVGARGVVLTPWPQAPIASLVGAQVIAWGADGQARWQVSVGEALEGGFVADLDGDGVGELWAWGRRGVYAIDAGGQVTVRASVPAVDGPFPWEMGPLDPVVLELGKRARALLCGATTLEGSGRELSMAVGRYEGNGTELVDAAGTRGFSVMGQVSQAFRGAYATPAAVMAPPRGTGFLVGHLERAMEHGTLQIHLRCYGVGGHRVSEGVVGLYDLRAMPSWVLEQALRPDYWACDERLAPLAVARPDGAFTAIVPYLCNVPSFGPMVVAFDAASGAELWRRPVRALAKGCVDAAPILADLEGSGRIELIYAGDGEIVRIDVATGELRPSLAISGVPVAVGDPEGRGRATLVVAMGSAIELWDGAPCVPGRMLWIGPRGDLWRSGTLDAAGLPIGPRV